MTKIYFYSPNGFAPLKAVRNILQESHGFALGDTSQPNFPIWGVAIPDSAVDAMEVVDALTAAGVKVFPSVHDSQPIPADVAKALASYGVVGTDTAHDCAKKMHAICGMPPLRPHLY